MAQLKFYTVHIEFAAIFLTDFAQSKTSTSGKRFSIPNRNKRNRTKNHVAWKRNDARKPICKRNKKCDAKLSKFFSL
jgi:hypothetical protein